MLDAPRYTVVADPRSMRWEFYERDLQAFWRERGQEPLVHMVPWSELIERDGDIGPLAKWDEPSILRIESPARDFEIIRKLMQAGERNEGREPQSWEPPGDRDGWIASPRLMYLGLCRTLCRLTETAGELLLPTTNVYDIQRACDKNASASAIRDAGLPIPDSFQPLADAQWLIEELKNKRKWDEAFVKLAYGSCASGMAVVRHRHIGPYCRTFVKQIEGHFYNSFQIQAIEQSAEIELLNFLIAEHAMVQRSIPKLTVDGQNFDVRVVIIGGEVAATVFRVSPHPMTNLHLGGRRGDEATCRRVIPQRYWLDGLDACVEAAELFDLPAVGIDLAFDQRDYSPQILEVNAFGDFFPHWKNADGVSLHTLEIAATARRLEIAGFGIKGSV